MGVGPGTMGLSLWAFLVVWVVMMAAMMFPSVAPMATLWIRSVAARPTRSQRIGGTVQFLGGFNISWGALRAAPLLALVWGPHPVARRSQYGGGGGGAGV